MRVASTYGTTDSPCLKKVSKGTRCHYCNIVTGRKIKFMEKDEEAVRLIFNSGPVGISYICKTHAKQLVQELTELLKN